jgi:hypothetical protein
MNTPTRLRLPLVLAEFVVAFTLGACSSAAAPASTPPTTDDPSASAIGGSASGGGGSSGDTGTGVIGGPVDPVPVDPGTGQAKLVIALPGRLNPHPVGVSLLEPSVNGHHVIVKITWYSGVAPCSVLDSVKVDRAANEIALTIIEGSSDQSAICIEIAEQKATIVDLGDFQPGEYKIFSPVGDAPPITITVS